MDRIDLLTAIFDFVEHAGYDLKFRVQRLANL